MRRHLGCIYDKTFRAKEHQIIKLYHSGILDNDLDSGYPRSLVSPLFVTLIRQLEAGCNFRIKVTDLPNKNTAETHARIF